MQRLCVDDTVMSLWYETGIW